MMLFGEVLQLGIDGELRLMAADASPHRLPMLPGVHDRSECPVRPLRSAALDAVDFGLHVAEGCLVRFPLRLAPGHIVQLRYPMRERGSATGRTGRVSGTDSSCSCELRNRDVIGMSISAFRPEG